VAYPSGCWWGTLLLEVRRVGQVQTLRFGRGHLRQDAMPGPLAPHHIKNGRPRERFRLYHRRAKPRVFGEPAFECELVPAHICPARPHILAWSAWRLMTQSAERDQKP
jgi:hypothetical protein